MAEEKLAIYREMLKNEPELALWDGLEVIGKDAGTLRLNHTWFLDQSTAEYSYPLP